VLAEARRFWSLWVGRTPCNPPVWAGVRLRSDGSSWTCVVSYSLPQLVIAESNPGLDGHKLAASLCKVPSIGVTLIPDSNIYALMARVNKVGSMGRNVLYSGLEHRVQGFFRFNTQNKSGTLEVGLYWSFDVSVPAQHCGGCSCCWM
jgi:hypothetical protein